MAGVAAVGFETRVNSFTTGDQISPVVAIDATGDYVAVWTSQGQDGSGGGLYAQRYNAAGIAQGGEFKVNSYTTSDQAAPSVAMDAAGDFVVTGQSRYQDGSGYGVYAQRYNAAGTVQGGEFKVNTYSTGQQLFPAVGMDAAGDFVITWSSNGQDGSGYGVYAQRYNSSGAVQGGEFKVNTYTTSNQFSPSIAMDAAGDFVIAFAGGDGCGRGLRDRLDEFWPGWEQLRHLFAAIYRDGRSNRGVRVGGAARRAEWGQIGIVDRPVGRQLFGRPQCGFRRIEQCDQSFELAADALRSGRQQSDHGDCLRI